MKKGSGKTSQTSKQPPFNIKSYTRGGLSEDDVW
jgi:hypothetical protein